MNAKMKLNNDSTHIIESDNDSEHIVFDRMESKERRRSETPRENMKISPTTPPVHTGRKFERLKAPNIRENSVPTIHSDTLKYTGPSRKEEVMLAVMDAHLNELKEEEQVLPDLRKVADGVAQLEKDAEKAGAPWSPGRFPEWSDK